MQKVREDLKKDLAEAQEEVKLVQGVPGLLEGYRTLSSPHYTILYPPADTKAAEARLKRLERVYAGFFYWFALQNQPLPMPQRKLVCVLADSTEKFKSLHQVFDSVEHVGDGFYAPIDNIAILAPKRLDSGYDQFLSKAGEIDKQFGEQGFDLTKLLQGRPLGKKVMDEVEPGKISYGQMMALAVEAAREEGEVATVTQEGTQQLASASGLLARRVRVPTAVRIGLGSFFETPKSAGELNLVSLWAGIGGAHWVYLPIYKKLVAAEASGTLKLDDKDPNAKVLRVDKLSVLRVLTDRGFDRSDKATDAAEKANYRTIARAEAWALTFFLMRDKLDGLRKFYDELSKMPREMELTPEIIEQAFGKAFNLLNDGTGDKIDPDKLETFEKNWKNFMGYQKPEHDPNIEPAKPKPRN
jgi:hypothetical protein